MACGGKTGRYFSFRKHYSRRSSRRMESKLVSKHLLPWFWLACFTLGGTGSVAAADHIFQIVTNPAVWRRRRWLSVLYTMRPDAPIQGNNPDQGNENDCQQNTDGGPNLELHPNRRGTLNHHIRW